MNTQSAAASRGNGLHLRPILGVTLGDVAGIGPEIVLGAWRDPRLHELCRPIVLGNGDLLRSLARDLPSPPAIATISEVEFAIPSPLRLDCIDASEVPVADLEAGRVHAAAGQAAYDYLVAGIDLALEKKIDGIVTMPLNKEGLHAAGLPYPGHTEILAERTGTTRFGMMLYRRGLGVVHVTLHMALREVFHHLGVEPIVEKIHLIHEMMTRLGHSQPRIGICALNPHAGDGGIFGDEEAAILRPAVERGILAGIDVSGPWPADTLFVRAAAGELDGVVAMYHDQGHIAMKLLGWREAVNITVGLPVIRTSVAHGTGYDIARSGRADPTSFLEAVDVASRLALSAT